MEDIELNDSTIELIQTLKLQIITLQEENIKLKEIIEDLNITDNTDLMRAYILTLEIESNVVTALRV